MMRPETPGLIICPVFGSKLPPDEAKAFKVADRIRKVDLIEEVEELGAKLDAP